LDFNFLGIAATGLVVATEIEATELVFATVLVFATGSAGLAFRGITIFFAATLRSAAGLLVWFRFVGVLILVFYERK